MLTDFPKTLYCLTKNLKEVSFYFYKKVSVSKISVKLTGSNKFLYYQCNNFQKMYFYKKYTAEIQNFLAIGLLWNTKLF